VTSEQGQGTTISSSWKHETQTGKRKSMSWKITNVEQKMVELARPRLRPNPSRARLLF